MRESLSNRSFLFLLASSISGAMAAGMAASLNIYFSTCSWEFSSTPISYLTLGVYLSAVFALIAVPILSRRFAKRTITRLMAVLSVTTGLTRCCCGSPA